MSYYLCDCRRCTNKYFRQNRDGSTDYWCKPTIDTGIIPIEVDGTSGKDFVIFCRRFLTNSVPEKYPSGK